MAALLKKEFYLTMLLCSLVLASILAYPIGWDQAIFIKMGKILLSGGTIYKDLIDLKPPLVYYAFALIIKIFGSGDFNIRLAEFLLNMFTCASIYYILAKLESPGYSRMIAPAAFALMYSTLGYGDSFQCETFIAPAMLYIIYFSIKKPNSALGMLIIGLLWALIVSFKYTFGAFFIAWILTYYWYNRRNIVKILIAASVFAFTFALIISSAIIGNTESFLEAMKFLSIYSKFSPLTPGSLIDFVSFTKSFFYLNVTFLFMSGLVYSVLKKNELNKGSKADSLILYMLVFFIAGMFGVAVENKFFPYHFSRILIFVSILGAIGLDKLYTDFRHIFSKGIMMPSLIISFLLVFSPIINSAFNYRPAYFKLTNNEKSYNDYFAHNDPTKLLNNSEKKYIIGKIKADNSRDYYKTTVSCNFGAVFNRFIGNEHYSRFASDQFILSKGIPNRWKEYAAGELNNSDWLIANKYTAIPGVYGHNMTSYQALKSDSIYNAIIERRYAEAFETDTYIVYRRK